MGERIARPAIATQWILHLFAATLIVLGGASRAAGAQIGRPRTYYGPEPDYWVGLSYGFVDGMTINDGETGFTWAFGYTSQIRATLEKTLQAGVTAGVSAGFSNAPLDYTINEPPPSPFPGCIRDCPANADISQYMAFIRSGSRPGFHGLFDVDAGATEFSHFRDRTTGEALRPSAKYDFTFGIGGGAGYGFSPTTEAYVTDGWQFVLHPQGPNASSKAPRMMTVQLGGRIGF
jgi:hypothetical protein